VNAAIVYVGGLGGGIVHLSLLGQHTVTASIVDGNQNNIVLEGEGESPILYCQDATSINVIELTSVTGWTIRDLVINGNQANQSDATSEDNQCGIYWNTITWSQITNITFLNAYYHNLNADNCDYCDIHNNKFRTPRMNAITIKNGTYNLVGNNRMYSIPHHGVSIIAEAWLVCVGNIMYEADDAFFTTDADYIVIVGNSAYDTSGDYAVRLHDCQYGIVDGNVFWMGTEATDEDVIRVRQNCQNCIISNNILKGAIRAGVYIEYYGTYADSDDTIVESNQIISCAIGIFDGGIGTLIYHNKFTGCTTIIDASNAVNQCIPTFQMPFVNGTLFLSADDAPWGWEIDEDTEYAIALGHLPPEVQQVIRWKIWAVGLAAPGAANKMRLEIVGRGGASDETYTTESVDVANKPSNEINFAINDIVSWTLTSSDDADVDDFLGGDAVMVKVKHEAAGNGDIATDAAFLCVDLEYV